ncbi:hypothetical protein NKH18_12065 [Streptomyces sp. M10(2022)]
MAGTANGVEYVPISGVLQPTPTTAAVQGEKLTGLLTIDGTDEGGDGRVPRLSSAHVGRRRAARVHALGEARLAPEQHGAAPGPLQLARPGPAGPPGPGIADIPLAVDAPDAITEGEVYELRATVPPHIPGHDRVVVLAAAEGGRVRTLNNLGGGRYAARLAGLPAGPHRVRVSTGNAGHVVMTALVLVLEGGAGDRE